MSNSGTIAEGVLSMCVLYAAASCLSTSVNATKLIPPAEDMAMRNMASFTAMTDDRRELNHSSRSRTWEDRQFAISHAILANGKLGWDWIPFAGYRYDLTETMKKANMALVPHAKPGQPATLVVDNGHGCLLVDVERDDEASADDARVLLDAFKRQSGQAYDYLGRYVLNDTAKEKVEFSAGGNAVEYCPKPQ